MTPARAAQAGAGVQPLNRPQIERPSPRIMDWFLPPNLGQFHAEDSRIAAVPPIRARTRISAMPDALDLLKTRRSVKPQELLGPAPTEAEIATLLTIASRVPDHGKLAPWRFIVFIGDARQRAGEAIAKAFAMKYPDATEEQIAGEASRLARAPLVIAVVSRASPHVKIPEWEQVLSAGAAAMNLVMGVYALGFAAAWITEWYAYDRAVLAALGLASHEKIAGFVHIGRPAHPPEERPRPALADIVTRF
jgi:nitroreductase